MDIDVFYLTWIGGYLLVVLAVGLWGLRRVKKYRDFATAGQHLPPVLACGSLFATFVSALTVVGGAGYASENGFALLTLFTVGTLGGCGFLTVSADRWRQANVSSVSELMLVRYGSPFLRSLLAVIIVFSYAVILVAQLLGVGHILEGLVGVPMGAAILVVGGILVIYTFLGGLVSVARTDLVHAVFILIGVVLTAGSLVLRLANDPVHAFTDRADLMTVFAGVTRDGWSIASYAFVFGLGVAIHPHYVQRLLAAADDSTARWAPTLSAAGVLVIQILLVVIGVIGSLYLPDARGDAMMPAIIKTLIGGPVGVLVMMAIVAAVVSTTDSLLHIVGTYLSQDIIGPWWLDRPTERQLLRWSRGCTAVFGFSMVGFTAYQAFHGEIELIAIIGAYAWGLLGGSLFVAIAAGLFWERATRAGAITAVVTGFLTSAIGHVLVERGVLGIHEIVPAIGVSLAGMVIVSLLTAHDSTRTTGRLGGI